MTKGRKTTQEERAEIVAFCIGHGKDYGLAVETYKVSYQQIYAWVHKYEEKGVEELSDRRGKAKPENELTEEDRLRQENKILQAKLKDQEMEIALLKNEGTEGAIVKRSVTGRQVYSDTASQQNRGLSEKSSVQGFIFAEVPFTNG